MSKYFKKGELQDKQIVAALHRAAEDYENGEIAASCDTGLRCGNKYCVALIGEKNTALDSGNDLALECSVVVESFLENNPAVVSVNSLLRNGCDTLAVLNSDYEDVNLVADLEHFVQLYVGIISNLLFGEHAGELSTKIKLDLVLADGEYGTGNCFSCM